MKTLENLGNLKFQTVAINPITKLPNVLNPKDDVIYIAFYENKISKKLFQYTYIYTDEWYLINIDEKTLDVGRSD